MALEGHRDELLADFQQYYHLPLPLADDEIDVERASILAAQLPHDSRTRRAIDPAREWSVEAHFLRLVEYEMRMLLWGMSDPKKRGEKPQPILSPAEEQDKAALVEAAEAVEGAVAAAFNIN